jgi:transposase
MDRTLGGIAADADRHGLEFATHVGAIPSIVVAWKQAPPGLRRQQAAPERGGDGGQRQRHRPVPGRRGRHPAGPDPAGRRRTRPAAIHADKGYDSRANRAWLCRRGIKPRIARRGIASSARLGRHRWKVERALSWLNCFRRLQVRWDRDAGRWFALVLVACAVVCFNRLSPVRGD